MFSSVKERLYSAVQEGIDLNNVVRRQISRLKSEEAIPSDSDAAAEILTKYRDNWTELHQNAEKNAQIAEEIDAELSNITESVKQQLDNMVAINAIFASLPQLTTVVENCLDDISRLSESFQLVEEQLIELEKLNERSEMKRREQEHLIQLTMYKEKKFGELEKTRVSLAKQQADSARATEQKQRATLIEKQRAAHDAFVTDLEAYKASGLIPKSDALSNENKPVLEDIQLDDDNTELNDFLNEQ